MKKSFYEIEGACRMQLLYLDSIDNVLALRKRIKEDGLDISIATLNDFDKVVAEVSLNQILNVIRKGIMDISVFDVSYMQSVLGQNGVSLYMDSLSDPLLSGKTSIIIIDDDTRRYSPDVLAKLEASDTAIVDSLNQAIVLIRNRYSNKEESADSFSSPGESYDIGKTDNKKLSENDSSSERLPGMRMTTPLSIDIENDDPFAFFDDDENPNQSSADNIIDDSPFALEHSESHQDDDTFADLFDDEPYANTPSYPGLSENQEQDDHSSDENPFPDSTLDQNSSSFHDDIDPFDFLEPSESDDSNDADQEEDVDLSQFIIDDDNPASDGYKDVDIDDIDYFDLSEFNDDTEHNSELTVNQLLRQYGNALGEHEYKKLISMQEPHPDYSVEHEDRIGKKGLFGTFGGSRSNSLSQVGSNELADSEYILDVEQHDGYYVPPNDCKIIVSASMKGGTGKTTMAAALATQLNWYFNRDLMQRLTTSINARILLLSVNEFDDIPTHGIGYDNVISEENETDGKDAYEFLQRLTELGDNPTWDDISYLFAAVDTNKIFYLPTVSHRKMIQENIDLTADDYQRIISVCSKFFQFIIIDSPDIFYRDKDDLMSFFFTISDIICIVIEADARSTLNLYHFFDGIRLPNGDIPIDPDKCILIVNKYVSNGNPYINEPPIGQIQYEKITKSMSRYFARFVQVPWTRPRAIGNILNGTDPKVKYAIGELADDVLDLIDYNDEKSKSKKALT